MTHDLGTIIGANHPCRIRSDARKYSWDQFAWLMLIFNVLFHGWWVLDVTTGFHF